MQPKGTSTRPQAKTVLIQINVTGSPRPDVILYYTNEHIQENQAIPVTVGDRVGWLVQLSLAARRTTPGYVVSFSDAAFFGVGSVSVPDGGVSEFLPVRSVDGRVSFSLNVSGVGCVFDPDIQSGVDPTITSTQGTPANFVVQWNTTSNSISYTKDGAPGKFPMQLVLSDNVTFEATPADPQHFTISFQPSSNQWGSPFGFDGAPLVPDADGKPATIGPKPVKDNAEGGDLVHNPVKFFFTASMDNAAPSPACEIDL
jgi:hypothetical protein